jgi:glycosyltransferase involved in cell wall biosynthesis
MDATLTAVVTNHNYGRYLPRCIESALPYCERILVYDDGSTDDSLDILSRYPVTVTHREMASGGPVWGSNLGMLDCDTTHLMFLDADNYLISEPPLNDVAYTFAGIDVVRDNESLRCKWRYPDWPLDPQECWHQFLSKCERGVVNMPVPWGGVWRTDFLADKVWTQWPSTMYAADLKTCAEWIQDSPSLAYHPTPFLAFRLHEGQWSESPERSLMEADAIEWAGVKVGA